MVHVELDEVFPTKGGGLEGTLVVPLCDDPPWTFTSRACICFGMDALSTEGGAPGQFP